MNKKEAAKHYTKGAAKKIRESYEKYQAPISVQTNATPADLVMEMVEKLNGLDGKDVLVVANYDVAVLIAFLKNMNSLQKLGNGYNFKSLTLLTDIVEIDPRFEDKFEVVLANLNEPAKIDMMGKKFDVVIGNPPYQSTTDGSNRKKAWVQFSELAMELAPVVAFVTPQAWQGTVKKYFKSIGDSIKSKLVVWEDANDHFKYVGEDIGYWITDANAEPIEFVKEEPYVDLFNKVRRTEDMPKWHYRDFQLPWVGNKMKNQHVDLTKEPTDTHTEPVFHTSKQVRFAEVKDVKYTGLKVMVNNSGGYHDDNDLDRYNWIENADKFVGQGMWGIKINTEEEGEAILSWIRCKLYRVLVKEMKAGGGFNNQFVELQHLGTDRIWTDADVYEHFNLTEEEIALVEDYSL